MKHVAKTATFWDRNTLFPEESERIPMTENAFFAFGALLKASRTRRRLTQQQLASGIGVHRSAIIRWEVRTFLPENKT